jgi:two-component system, LytTR family, sensor kinase
LDSSSTAPRRRTGWIAAIVAATIFMTTAVRMSYLPRPEGVTYLDMVGLTFSRHAVFLVTIYIGTVAIFHAATYYDAYRNRALHASRLQTRLAHVQLDVLKMQLQPHFLFNTLNTIASLMFKHVLAAQAMIVRLREVPVPRLILQPLVENAIRHGIGERAGRGRVVVRAALQDSRLSLEVLDRPGTARSCGGAHPLLAADP